MKRLIGKIAVIALISATPVALYNYFIDQYFVLRQNVASMRVLPNERWVKTEYLIKNPAKYDSIVFSSSRGSQLPIEFINQHTGGRYYNMTLMAGVPSDHLSILKILVRNKVAIKHVLIGLDYYSFQGATPAQFYRGIMYPDDPWERMKNYFDYLFLPFDSTVFNELNFDGKDVAYDIFGTGEYTFLKKEKSIAEHPEQHPARFQFPILVVCDDRIDKTLSEIKQIISLCRANGITTTFFINPEYAPSYLCADIDFINKVCFRFSEITDFWDFNGSSSVTGDMYNYVDLIHFRRPVGRMMMARIFNVPDVAPADFGKLVTRSNVAAFTAEAKRAHEINKKKVKLNCAPCRQALWK
ncbi:MAG TPA: hypothetical protein PLM53_11625 [Spirochaetota bacterium]|nr:hypothetical protein [Spirochaetota bacterium]HPC41416.1 hypothetical protein [Spirochaetota bacterium]HPL17060.1 hypothetical protein [Spirochaetota bacterium]HQF09201.1 hypothetical protein [Spirochaetota bacterium]HQH97742.1 hypothetical protein [Spirochaetota bacterium]